MKVTITANKTHLNRLVVTALKENGYIEVDIEQSVNHNPSNQLEVLQLQIKLKEIEKETEKARAAFELEKLHHEMKLKELELQGKKPTNPVH